MDRISTPARPAMPLPPGAQPMARCRRALRLGLPSRELTLPPAPQASNRPGDSLTQLCQPCLRFYRDPNMLGAQPRAASVEMTGENMSGAFWAVR
jgi:hypothetical protein